MMYLSAPFDSAFLQKMKTAQPNVSLHLILVTITSGKKARFILPQFYCNLLDLINSLVILRHYVSVHFAAILFQQENII